jgi:ABC-type nickel/cobalt efflux system permease component RcnA
MTFKNSKVPKSKGSGPDSLRLEYAALLVTGSGVINTPEALPFSTLTADNDGAIALALTSASCESSKSLQHKHTHTHTHTHTYTHTHTHLNAPKMLT